MTPDTGIRVRGTVVVAALGLLAWSLTVLAPASQAATDPCASPTIVGTEASDDITGTEGADVIDAGAGDDVVQGLGGDDVLCGGDDGDTLIGGAGDDQLYGEEQVTVLAPDGSMIEWRPDVLDGGPGDDYFDGGGTDPGGQYGGDFLTFQDAAQGVSVYLPGGSSTGEGTDTIVVGTSPGEVRWNVVGSPFADELMGENPEAEVLVGGTGDDYLFGNYGADALVDGVAGCACAPGMVVPGGGDDTMSGSGSDDVIFGGTGQDDLDGGVGHDRMWGGGGDDTVYGGPAGDRLWGGAGNDTVSGSYGQDVARGGPGRDVVSGDLLGTVEEASDRVFGGPGPDRVLDYGEYHPDVLRGGAGDDLLRNSVSARGELVAGGRGTDTLRRAPEDRISARMECRSIEIDRTHGQCR